jgi:hypothetical protein
MNPSCDDGTMREDSALKRLANKMIEAMQSIQPHGSPNASSVAYRIGDILARAGFVNIKCTTIKLPMGRWPKVGTCLARPASPFHPSVTMFPGQAAWLNLVEQKKRLRAMGECMNRMLLEALPALETRVMLRVMTEEEMRTIVAAAVEELGDTSQHIYTDFLFWYAQKPQVPGASHL